MSASRPGPVSNIEKGAASLDALKAYLDGVDVLPERAGRVNISAVAIAAGGR